MKRASLVFILDREEQLLLVKRTAKDVWMPGKWALPGGTSDPGELAINTAKREVQEEVNLKVSALELVEELEYHRNGHDWKISYFHASLYAGNVKINEEHDDFAWVHIEKVAEMDTVPYLKDLIKKHFVV